MLRAASGGPLKVTSGYRSPDHNRRIGGARRSRHVTGEAADLKSALVPASRLYAIAVGLIRVGRLQDGGLGRYRTWIHYDIGPTGRRWKG